MIHEMRLYQSPFDRIKTGEKQIELRLYDEKRQKLHLGDMIRFTCGNIQLRTEITGLLIYPTFKDLIQDLGLAKFGYDEEYKEDFLNGMYEIYTKEQEEKYGVLGIKLRLITNY